MSSEFISEIAQVEWVHFGRRIGEVLRLSGGANSDGRFIFRGQKRAAWGLVSSFDRLADRRLGQKDRRRYYEDYVIRLASTLCAGKYVTYPPAERGSGRSMIPYETLAQHHGAPSRLLDWSMSPYVAAFFAYQQDNNVALEAGNDPVVWALDTNLLQDALSEDDCQVLRESYVAVGRLTAQLGCFTRNSSSFSDLAELISLSAKGNLSNSNVPVLWKFILRRSDRETALFDLKLMGLSLGRLFPDIDGVLRAVRSDVEADLLSR